MIIPTSAWFNTGDTKGREGALEKIKLISSLDRAYRTEVQDPTLRLNKLKELWKHSDFITSWAGPSVVALQLKEILDYQLSQIGWLIAAKKGTSREPGIQAQQLAVLNKIFEIVSTLSTSAHGEVISEEDRALRLEEEWEKKKQEFQEELKKK